jgi:hypothetical protein
MTVELHKEDYADESMYGKILETARKYGTEFEQGAEVRYVKCKKGYVPYPLPNYDYRLDYDYYRERLAHVLARILGPTKRLGKKQIETIMKEGQMVL